MDRSSTSVRINYDAVVIGAGFAGMYAIHKLREQGFTVHAFESGSEVGGTWYWNRYPGARCDVESLSYQYTFDAELITEWTWTERFATQPEILAYARWVADKLDLRRDITFKMRVTSAVFDEESSMWVLSTGDGRQTRARYCVSAVGCLSAASMPQLPGLDTFGGAVYHTGAWPHEGVDFTGKRVAVIGTGSSGIQAIPAIAQQAAHLTVFQRTPNYTLPARNRQLYADENIYVKKNHAQLKQRARHCPVGIGTTFGLHGALELNDRDRVDTLDRYWSHGGNIFLTAFHDIARDIEANHQVADYVRSRIAMIVEDPDTARKLTPTDYPIGAKRICVDTDYYATFNLPSVDLVDVREDPIVEFTERGISTTEHKFDFDAIVLATGYDGMTGSLTRIDIRGRDGMSLKEKWTDGPKTYLGVASHGFPNLFMITGPGSPSVLANVIACIEQHVEWIVECLVRLRNDGVVEVEANHDEEVQWGQHVNDVAAQTLFVRAKSWYSGDNIEGKPRVFMPYPGGLDIYRDICDNVASLGYKGFTLTPDVSTRVAVSSSSTTSAL